MDVRELTITGADVPRYALASGSTTMREARGIRIVPTSPVSIGTGERLVVAAQPW